MWDSHILYFVWMHFYYNHKACLTCSRSLETVRNYCKILFVISFLKLCCYIIRILKYKLSNSTHQYVCFGLLFLLVKCDLKFFSFLYQHSSKEFHQVFFYLAATVSTLLYSTIVLTYFPNDFSKVITSPQIINRWILDYFNWSYCNFLLVHYTYSSYLLVFIRRSLLLTMNITINWIPK